MPMEVICFLPGAMGRNPESCSLPGRGFYPDMVTLWKRTEVYGIDFKTNEIPSGKFPGWGRICTHYLLPGTARPTHVAASGRPMENTSFSSRRARSGQSPKGGRFFTNPPVSRSS